MWPEFIRRRCRCTAGRRAVGGRAPRAECDDSESGGGVKVPVVRPSRTTILWYKYYYVLWYNDTRYGVRTMAHYKIYIYTYYFYYYNTQTGMVWARGNMIYNI